MRILNNVATQGNGVIAGRIMKLLVILKRTGTSAELLDQLGNVKVELKASHPPTYGTKTLIYENSFLHLAEIASCNEGAIRVLAKDGVATLRATIELSDSGALQPIEKEEFVFTIKGLPNGITATVHSIDADEDTNQIFEYKPVNCQGGVPTPVEVSRAKWISFPKSTFKEVSFEMADGQKVNYDFDELEQMLSEGNEQAIIIDGSLTAGGYQLLTFNVAAAKTAHVTVTETTNIYVVNTKFTHEN